MKLTDSKKLRLLADWFDTFDPETDRREVQDDLRRIAGILDQLTRKSLRRIYELEEKANGKEQGMPCSNFTPCGIPSTSVTRCRCGREKWEHKN
jgi:hypothetical protein